jgi:hypothetical protein
VTPIEAARAEVNAELDALARRIGSGPAPDAIVIRVELDRESGMPRAVDCQEERRRRVLGGSVVSRRASGCASSRGS